MKEVLFLFSILIFYSCTTKSNGSDTFKSKEGEVPAESIREFTYKRHSYIMFNRGYGTGIVHNPDCSYCYNKFD